MKINKLLIILAIVLFIALFLPISALAEDNEFTATLSVNSTQVKAGSVVISTITVTNKDNTYGADISVSYNGEHIKSFYLSAGQQSSFLHNVIVTKSTAISYTVNASHGPDITNTKQTNVVLVTIIQPDTPAPTATTSSTPTPSPTTTPTVEPTDINTSTITTTPPATSTEVITPEPTQQATASNTIIFSDENTGWGAFIQHPAPPLQLLGGLYGTDVISWLGFNKDFSNTYDNNVADASDSSFNHNKTVYTQRRWILIALSSFLLISIASSIVSMINLSKKNHS